jgi:hypothetical protein
VKEQSALRVHQPRAPGFGKKCYLASRNLSAQKNNWVLIHCSLWKGIPRGLERRPKCTLLICIIVTGSNLEL